MSQENVEIVRRGNLLLNAGDWDAAFAPGDYLLRITATDRVRNQTVQQQSTFTVSATP